MTPQRKMRAADHSFLLRVVRWIGLLVACGVTLYWSNQFISDGPVRADALENFQTAYNLVRYGEFSQSTDLTASLAPTMSREPFPIWVLAGWIKSSFNDVANADPHVINGRPQFATL